ncbi:MAG: hypothetical protein A2Y73_06720 [Chloroflexi bacterium RBG_13_56_8]|nr:MAG: hypothetical protein A2Y73_06720 [Chloroflexi bacterium RBG_13_56_8]
MKRAVSVSQGSKTHDYNIIVELLGQEISIERIGTNLMETTLVALAGKGRPLKPHEVEEMLDALGWHPNLEKPN